MTSSKKKFGLREGSGKSGCTRWCSVIVGNGEVSHER